MCIGQNKGNMRIRIITYDRASSACEAVAHRIMNEVICIQFSAHSGVKSKGIPRLLARTLKDGEEGHHDMPRKCVGEGIVVNGIENVPWNEGAIERH